MTGAIFDIKEFSVHDGPGPRLTVFFKGCPLRCVWCHNPEGLEKKKQLMVKKSACKGCGLCMAGCEHPECQEFKRCLHACPDGLISISGKTVSADELAEKIMRDADFYRANGGGVTFSGGEPLMQWEFLLELCDKIDIHKAIETSGYAESEIFERVLAKMDFVIMDVKIADRERHKRYTGVYNDKILKNLEILKNSGKEYVIRTPLIDGICNTEENLSEITRLIGNSRWEQLPENTMAGLKYPMLDMKYIRNDKAE